MNSTLYFLGQTVPSSFSRKSICFVMKLLGILNQCGEGVRVRIHVLTVALEYSGVDGGDLTAHIKAIPSRSHFPYFMLHWTD